MASGDTLVAFEPLANEPPAAAGATVDTRNGQVVLDFDDTTDESAIFSAVLPRHYGGGGITATIAWTATSAVAGTARLDLAFERQDPGTDLDADSFAAAKSVTTAAAPATSGQPVYTTLAFLNTEIDGLLVGERFRLKLTRDANHATDDTMTGDFELRGIELKET